MKNLSILLVFLFATSVLSAQRVSSWSVQSKTDNIKGITHEISDTPGNASIQPIIQTGGVKEAGLIWQASDAAGIGSKVKVSGNTAETFNTWYLNNVRASLYGNTSNPIWEVQPACDYEWPIDMTEDGQYVAQGYYSNMEVFFHNSHVPIWAAGVTGNITGVQLTNDGQKIFVSSDNSGTSFVSAFSFGNSTPDWTVPFPGTAVALVLNGAANRLIFCQYGGEYNKLWVLNPSDGSGIWDTTFKNQNPPAISFDGKYIVSGDYSGYVYLYEFNENTGKYFEKWNFKVNGSSAWVAGMGISADGNYIAAGSLVFLTSTYEGDLYVFRNYSPQPIWSASGMGDMVAAVDLSDDGAIIACGGWGPLTNNKPDIFLFRRQSSTPYFTINSPGSIFGLDLSSDGKYCSATGKGVHARVMGSGGNLYHINSNPGGGEVHGFVNLEGSTDLLGARIEVEGLDTWFDISDNTGHYSIKFIPAGIYNIIASKPGYIPYTYSMIQIEEGGIVSLLFDLQPTGPAPMQLIASKGASLSVMLDWTPPATGNITGYNIYRKRYAEEPFPADPIATVGQQNSDYDDNTALPVFHYFYTVTAILDNGLETPFANVVEGWITTTFITNEIDAYLCTAPIIDGTISPGEYDCAFQIDQSDFLGKNDNSVNPIGSVMGYYMASPDKSMLYVAVENFNDVVLEDHDEIALYVDDNNDGTYPATGDDSEGNYWAVYYASGNLIRYRPIYNTGGVGTVVELTDPQIEVSIATGHMVYEFAIPLGSDQNWKINFNEQSQSGMFMFALDDPSNFDGYWPCTNPQIFNPVDYGTITFGGADQTPPAPSGLTLFWFPEAPFNVMLDWTTAPINDFDHNNIYWSNDGGLTFNLYDETIGTQYFIELPGVANYHFYVTTMDKTGHESDPSNIAICDIISSLPENQPSKNYLVSDIQPNPFREQVSFNVSSFKASHVSILITGTDGMLIRSLFSGTLSEGTHRFVWDATTQAGVKARPGIYLMQINSGYEKVVKKLVLTE